MRPYGDRMADRDAFICDAVRTPIGRYGGVLSRVRADDLAAAPIAAILERNLKVDWERVDDTVFGCANQAGEDNRNVARMALLLAGMPESVPGVTVNRLCGSGMEAVAMAARQIKSGEANLVVAGGVESMSRAPLVMAKAETAFSRKTEVFDTTLGWRFINPVMAAQYGVESMPETAENVAEEYDINREDQDLFAVRSQQRAAAAKERAFFQREIIPVSIPRRKGEPTVVAEDEHPRPDTTLADLAKLPTPFRSGGTVTAGNASGINDGACALLLASRSAVDQYGLVPRARVLHTATAGVAPRVMGIGPAPASRRALDLAGLRLEQMETIELNEAFAAQGLAVLRLLGLADDCEHVNPNGGAIALGHPLGMSGARLITTAVSHLHDTRGRYGLCTMCIGVGQGIAMVIERV